jgi:hypothetical protein
MTMQFGVLLPQAWNMDLVGIKDPVEAYETMTHIAHTADEAGFTSVWLIDHFHTIPRPSQGILPASRIYLLAVYMTISRRRERQWHTIQIQINHNQPIPASNLGLMALRQLREGIRGPRGCSHRTSMRMLLRRLCPLAILLLRHSPLLI